MSESWVDALALLRSSKAHTLWCNSHSQWHTPSCRETVKRQRVQALRDSLRWWRCLSWRERRTLCLFHTWPRLCEHSSSYYCISLAHTIQQLNSDEKFTHTKSDEIINSFELLTLTCQLSRILLLWKKEFWIYVARIFPGFIGDHNFAFDCKLVSSIPSETLRVFSCHHGPREKFILDRNFLSTTKSDCNVI